MDRIALSFSPLRDALPADILAWSRAAEERGFHGVFIPESFNDSLAYAQAVAAATTKLHVGTAITNVYLRHPTLLAQQAAAVQEFSHGRLHLGLGVGHQVVNRSLGIEMGDATCR
jgi:5,10-methylenetetrahydromethanopterin reductase